MILCLLLALVAGASGRGLCRDLPAPDAPADPDEAALLQADRETWRCAPASPAPSALVLNRVPKCGSTSLQGIVRALAPLNGFDYCQSHVFRRRWLPAAEREAFAALDWCDDPAQAGLLLGSPAGEPRRLLADRHVFWLDMARWGGHAPGAASHVNVLRDPVARCESRYRFERKRHGWAEPSLGACMASGRCDFSSWVPGAQEEFDLGSEGSLALLHEECSGGYLTRWFCGMHSDCEPGRPTALRQAKLRLAGSHAFVGLLEEMPRTLAMLDLTLPGFFRFADALPEVHINSSPAGDPGLSLSLSLSPEQERLLRRLNADDIALYEFARRLFWQRVGSCCGRADGSRERTRERLRAQKQQLRANPAVGQHVERALREYAAFF